MEAYSFHRLASLELHEAARYYESESLGLGLRFIDAVENSVRRVLEFPVSGQVIGRDVRRALVRGFPYGVLYREKPDHIRILAIMNLRRRPMYWVGRE